MVKQNLMKYKKDYYEVNPILDTLKKSDFNVK